MRPTTEKKSPVLLVLVSGLAFVGGFLLPGRSTPATGDSPGADAAAAPPSPAPTRPPAATIASTSLAMVKRGAPQTAADFVKNLKDLHPEDRDYLFSLLSSQFDEDHDAYILFIKEVALLLSQEDRNQGLNFIGRFAREKRILNTERYLVAQWANSDLEGLFQHFHSSPGAPNQSQLQQVAAVLSEEASPHFDAWLKMLVALEQESEWDLQRGGLEGLARQSGPTQRKAVLDQLLPRLTDKEGFWSFPAMLIGNQAVDSPSEARQWLVDLPPGPWKDQSLASFLQSTGQYHPALGAEFLNDPASMDIFNVSWAFNDEGRPMVTEGSREEQASKNQFFDLALSHFFDNAMLSDPRIVATNAHAFTDPELRKLYLEAAERQIKEAPTSPPLTEPSHQHGPNCQHGPQSPSNAISSPPKTNATE
jgi:hypothetical protein